MEESKTLGPGGADRVQFLLEANQGQTRGTVDAVASSGEKSRLLLLLETRLPPPFARSSVELGVGNGEADAAGIDGGSDDLLLAQSGPGSGGVDGDVVGTGGAADGVVVRAAPCAVLYDEIDAHVGGRTAVAVGRLLANQGRDSQVRRSGHMFTRWSLPSCLEPDTCGRSVRVALASLCDRVGSCAFRQLVCRGCVLLEFLT